MKKFFYIWGVGVATVSLYSAYNYLKIKKTTKHIDVCFKVCEPLPVNQLIIITEEGGDVSICMDENGNVVDTTVTTNGTEQKLENYVVPYSYTNAVKRGFCSYYEYKENRIFKLVTYDITNKKFITKYTANDPDVLRRKIKNMLNESMTLFVSCGLSALGTMCIIHFAL